MNHIKEALKNKNGDAYIWLCVIVVFISMLLSVLILYMGILSQVQIQKREVKTKLDSVVSEYATEMFDAIKQGALSELYSNIQIIVINRNINPDIFSRCRNRVVNYICQSSLKCVAD